MHVLNYKLVNNRTMSNAINGYPVNFNAYIPTTDKSGRYWGILRETESDAKYDIKKICHITNEWMEC